MELSNLWAQTEYLAIALLYPTVGALLLRFVVRIWWASRQRSNQNKAKPPLEISNVLLLNMCCWILLSVTALPFIAYALLMLWTTNAKNDERYSYGLYWTGIWAYSLMPVVTCSVFLLSLSRLFSVWLLLKYTPERERTLFRCGALSLVGVFALNFWAFTWELPLDTGIDCLTFGCLIKKTGSLVFVCTKICAGTCTVLCCLLMVYKLLKLKALTAVIIPLAQVQSNATVPVQNEQMELINRNIYFQIGVELALNFTPQVVRLALLQFTGILVSDFLGPYNLTLAASEGLISTLLYRKMMSRFFSAIAANNNPESQKNPNLDVRA